MNKICKHGSRESKQRFDDEAALNRCIGVALISNVFGLYLYIALSLWIKANGNIVSVHSSLIIVAAIAYTIVFRCMLIHFEMILPNKPSMRDSCNQAMMRYYFFKLKIILIMRIFESEALIISMSLVFYMEYCLMEYMKKYK